MRSGRLLAEESPHMLLRLHASLTLEDVFLKLCVKSTVSEHSVTDQAVAPISNGNGFSNRGVDNPAFSHDARQAATEIHKDDVGHEKDGSLFAAVSYFWTLNDFSLKLSFFFHDTEYFGDRSVQEEQDFSTGR